MPEKFTKLEYNTFKTAPAESFEPRDGDAWKDAPEGVVEGAETSEEETGRDENPSKKD